MFVCLCVCVFVCVFLSHSQPSLLSVDNRACDTSHQSRGLLCSILAGVFTDSSGDCYSLILLKASELLQQSSHWSHRELFTASTGRIVPMDVEHCRIPWEGTTTLTREMPIPLLLYSKPLCMFKVYKILLGKYKWKNGFPSFCLD